MNHDFRATLRLSSLSAEDYLTIHCASLATMNELVAHIELFKPGAVASAHRGLAAVLAEDNPAVGVDVGPAVAFVPIMPDPAQVFGGAAAPLPPAPAPSTVVAEVPQTAPITSTLPPAPPAPAAMPVPPVGALAESAAPTSLVVRDADGVPWDHRIHAESKAMIADGTWRKRRNLPDGLHEQITAELKALAGLAAAPISTGAALPPAATMSAAHTETVVQATPTESTYAAFMGYLNTVMTGANIKLTIQDLAALIATTGEQFGLTEKLNLQSLKHASELIQTAARLEVEKFVAAKS